MLRTAARNSSLLIFNTDVITRDLTRVKYCILARYNVCHKSAEEIKLDIKSHEHNKKNKVKQTTSIKMNTTDYVRVFKLST